MVYESLISVSPLQITYINLSRMILGKNCTPSTDITDHKMVKYQIRIIAETNGKEEILYETDWNTSTANINIEIRTLYTRTYKIQILTKEKVRNRPEIISISHPNTTHVHSYLFCCNPANNYTHYAECACKDSIYERHTYPENSSGTRICTKCNYPEGFLPN